MNNLIHLSVKQLRRAANLKHKIGTLQSKLAGLLGDTDVTPAPRKRRKMSAKARAKIGAAQRARWKKQRATKTSKSTPQPGRKFNVAMRKRLAQLAKARWKKAKAAGKSRL